MVSNNTHQVKNLQNSKTMDTLFSSSRTCIESFWYTTLSGITSTQSLNFGPNNLNCFTGSYDQVLTFTGISLEKNNATGTGVTIFWSYFMVENNTGTLRVYSTISDGTEKKDYNFVVGQ